MMTRTENSFPDVHSQGQNIVILLPSLSWVFKSQLWRLQVPGLTWKEFIYKFPLCLNKQKAEQTEKQFFLDA